MNIQCAENEYLYLKGRTISQYAYHSNLLCGTHRKIQPKVPFFNYYTEREIVFSNAEGIGDGKFWIVLEGTFLCIVIMTEFSLKIRKKCIYEQRT